MYDYTIHMPPLLKLKNLRATPLASFTTRHRRGAPDYLIILCLAKKEHNMLNMHPSQHAHGTVYWAYGTLIDMLAIRCVFSMHINQPVHLVYL